MKLGMKFRAKRYTQIVIFLSANLGVTFVRCVTSK